MLHALSVATKDEGAPVTLIDGLCVDVPHIDELPLWLGDGVWERDAETVTVTLEEMLGEALVEGEALKLEDRLDEPDALGGRDVVGDTLDD